MARYGTNVEKAIKDARVRGDRPCDVRVALAAGTLPGIDKPVQMAERSFWTRWSNAKREQQGPPASDPNVPNLLDRIGVEIRAQELGLTDPDEIARELGYTPEFVRACLEANKARVPA